MATESESHSRSDAESSRFLEDDQRSTPPSNGVASSSKRVNKGRKRANAQCKKALSQEPLELIQNSRFLEFVHSDEFDVENAENNIRKDEPVIRHDEQTKEIDPESDPFLSELSEVPLLTFKQEQYYFRLYNFLKYLASKLVSALDRKNPSAEVIQKIEKLFLEIQKLESILVKANLRLVVSIGNKFVRPDQDFLDAKSEGDAILFGAVQRFDYMRRYRFSTYVTHSVQRHFWRKARMDGRRRERFRLGEAEYLAKAQENNDADATSLNSDDMLPVMQEVLRSGVLDERERTIIERRFFGNNGKGEILRKIAADMGLSKERVRQLQVKGLETIKKILMERCQVDENGE